MLCPRVSLLHPTFRPDLCGTGPGRPCPWLPGILCSLSEKGPSEDPQPEERPVEGEAPSVPFHPITRSVSPKLFLSPVFLVLSTPSLPSPPFGGGSPVGCPKVGGGR